MGLAMTWQWESGNLRIRRSAERSMPVLNVGFPITAPLGRRDVEDAVPYKLFATYKNRPRFVEAGAAIVWIISRTR